MPLNKEARTEGVKNTLALLTGFKKTIDDAFQKLSFAPSIAGAMKERNYPKAMIDFFQKQVDGWQSNFLVCQGKHTSFMTEVREAEKKSVKAIEKVRASVEDRAVLDTTIPGHPNSNWAGLLVLDPRP